MKLFTRVMHLIFLIGALLLNATQVSAQSTLSPTADTYIQSGAPTQNYGTSTTLLTRIANAEGLTRAAHLQFDLSALPSTVRSARLRVYGRHDAATGTGIPVYAFSGNNPSPWNETQITWNNASQLTGVNFTTSNRLTSTHVGIAAGYVEWDVTAYINQRRTTGHATIGLYVQTTHQYRVTFNSKEATANRPQLVISSSDPVSNINWPMFGSNYENSRVSSSQWINSTNVASLRVINRYAGNAVSGTPVVVDNIIYYADTSGRLYARNFDTGALVWPAVTLSSGPFPGTPFVSSDTIYVAGEGSRVYAVNRATGALRWTSPRLETTTFNRIWSSPILVGNRLIVGLASYQVFVPAMPMFRGSIVAIDVNNNGAVLWRRLVCPTETCGGGISVWSSVAVDQQLRHVYIGTGQAYTAPAGPYSDALVAINYETGNLVWARQFTANDVWSLGLGRATQDYDVGAAPNLFSINGVKMVGVGDKGGRYNVMDRATGAIVWQRAVGAPGALGGVMGTAAYRDGRIYLVSNRLGLVSTSTAYSLDATSGNIIWSRNISSAAIGSVSLANDVMYFATFNGVLQALNANTGAVLRTVQIAEQPDTNSSISSGNHPNGSGSGAIVHRGRVLVGYGYSWSFSTTGGLAVMETDRGIEPR